MSTESYQQMANEAVAAIRSGNRIRALSLLDQLATRYPSRASIHALRGDALKSFGEFAKAHDEARIAVGLDPNSIPGHQVLADTAWDLGHLLEAQNAYERLLELEVDPELLADARTKYAMFMAYERAPRLAIKAARDAIDLAPKNPDAWAALGMAQFRDRKNEEAERSLNEAIKLNGESLHSYWVLANVYKWQGKDDKAQAIAKLMADLPMGKGMAQDIHEHIRKKRFNQGIKPG